MRRVNRLLAFAFCGVVFSTGFMIGCGGTSVPKPQAEAKPKANHEDHKDGDDHDHKTAAKPGKAHDHSGWWCDEHGVPEGICAQCSSKVAADFQKKGDWCKDHDRPDSQCFKCHPEREAKFAAQYEAKYGKKPPKPEIN